MTRRWPRKRAHVVRLPRPTDEGGEFSTLLLDLILLDPLLANDDGPVGTRRRGTSRLLALDECGQAEPRY